ncbi:MAG TPA: hypothetical protein VN176_12645 [Verrucomicrobiae bacterium]|jgi:hypothetical protein|nr:hypothetical protein [Verrucomicrobiae bacterium]
MPGSIPGPLGAAAFAGVKFCGYTVAGAALRRIYPATRSWAITIGTTRLLLGLVIGIAHLALWGTILTTLHKPDGFAVPWFFSGLLVLRFVIWMATIWFFCDRRWERPKQTLAWAAAGTGLSFLLDVIGIALAFVAPGKIPFC